MMWILIGVLVIVLIVWGVTKRAKEWEKEDGGDSALN